MTELSTIFDVDDGVSGDLRSFEANKTSILLTLDVLLNNWAISCMAEQGFTLQRQRPGPSPFYFPYGLPETADSSSGFHVPFVDGALTSPVEDSPEDPAFWAALTGSAGALGEGVPVALPSGGSIDLYRVSGCLGEARENAFGSQDYYLEGMSAFLTLQDLALTSRVAAEASAEFVSLNLQWSACMKSVGYSFAAPIDAWNSSWPDPLSQEEVNAADADIDCKRSLSYTDTATRIIADFDGEAIEAHPGLIENWMDFEKAAGEAVRQSP